MSCREGLPGRTSCWFSMALPTIVAETSRFPPTSRCSSCHPTRQSSIQRKTSGMKSARNSSRTMPSSPSMPCAESSSRRSSISSAIPKPLNPSPRSPTSSGHSDVEVVLDQRSPDELADRLRGFRQGLKEIGYVEGENVVIEYRWAEGQYDRLPELAAELV